MQTRPSRIYDGATVTDQGTVIFLGVTLKQYLHPRDGYPFIWFRFEKWTKKVRLEVLVADAFIGKWTGQRIRHKNGDKKDCRPENLYYVSQKTLEDEKLTKKKCKRSRRREYFRKYHATYWVGRMMDTEWREGRREHLRQKRRGENNG